VGKGDGFVVKFIHLDDQSHIVRQAKKA
jgi:hypothetical protein